jgi:hypothetical protein
MLQLSWHQYVSAAVNHLRCCCSPRVIYFIHGSDCSARRYVNVTQILSIAARQCVQHPTIREAEGAWGILRYKGSATLHRASPLLTLQFSHITTVSGGY